MERPRPILAWSGRDWRMPVWLRVGLATMFFIARLGIGGWMLMFAVFGYGLTRMEDRDA